MGMSKRARAKARSNRSYRAAVLAGYAGNNEPAFKRERLKSGGRWRKCKNQYHLLYIASLEAKRNEFLLATGQF